MYAEEISIIISISSFSLVRKADFSLYSSMRNFKESLAMHFLKLLFFVLSFIILLERCSCAPSRKLSLQHVRKPIEIGLYARPGKKLKQVQNF